MFNVEFLPDWYSVLRRRKAAVLLQASISLVILLGMVTIILARCWEIHSRHQEIAEYDKQIQSSSQRLAQLDQVLVVQQKLHDQERQIARLGLNVDTTRVLKTLETAMPPKMALTGLSVETQEPAAATPAAEVPSNGTDRWLSVRLQGVAPTDVEVAMLLDKLSKLKIFDDVAMTYIRDRTESGRAMRDFELRFRINLNVPPEAHS